MKYKEKKRDSNLFLQVIMKEDDKEGNTSEPIVEKFDYSLGGYSHRERWSRTR
jgi:hypothetical protein